MLFCWCLITVPFLAAEDKKEPASQGLPASIKVGDKAPELKPGKWLQGGPITIEPGKCYMVEFWATWCGPCVASIPHLEKLHRKYKDKGFIIIGMNAGETDEKKVQAFLNKRKDEMTYAVAFPGADYPKTSNWLNPAGQNGIPCSFLIDKNGNIAAITHPIFINDEAVEAFLSGKPIKTILAAAEEKATRHYGQLADMTEQLRKAQLKNDWQTFEKTLVQMEKDFPENKTESTIARLELAVGKKDVSATMDTVRKLIRDDNEITAYALEVATVGAVPFSKENLQELKSLAQKALAEIKAEKDIDDFSIIMGTTPLSRVLFLEGDTKGAIAALDAIKLKSADDESAIINKVREALKNSFKNGTMPADFIKLFNQVAEEEVRKLQKKETPGN